MDTNAKFAAITDAAFAQLESQWEKAHQDLVEAYRRREEAGQDFWHNLELLEARCYALGEAIDRFKRWYYRSHQPEAQELVLANRHPHLTPAEGTRTNPRAETREVPLPFVPEDKK